MKKYLLTFSLAAALLFCIPSIAMADREATFYATVYNAGINQWKPESVHQYPGIFPLFLQEVRRQGIVLNEEKEGEEVDFRFVVVPISGIYVSGDNNFGRGIFNVRPKLPPAKFRLGRGVKAVYILTPWVKGTFWYDEQGVIGADIFVFYSHYTRAREMLHGYMGQWEKVASSRYETVDDFSLEYEKMNRLMVEAIKRHGRHRPLADTPEEAYTYYADGEEEQVVLTALTAVQPRMRSPFGENPGAVMAPCAIQAREFYEGFYGLLLERMFSLAKKTVFEGPELPFGHTAMEYFPRLVSAKDLEELAGGYSGYNCFESGIRRVEDGLY